MTVRSSAAPDDSGRLRSSVPEHAALAAADVRCAASSSKWRRYSRCAGLCRVVRQYALSLLHRRVAPAF